MTTPPTIKDRIRDDALERGRDYVNSAQAAAYLGLADPTLRGWRVKRVGPRYSKVGASVRYSFDDLDDWLDAQYIDTAAPGGFR